MAAHENLPDSVRESSANNRDLQASHGNSPWKCTIRFTVAACLLTTLMGMVVGAVVTSQFASPVPRIPLDVQTPGVALQTEAQPARPTVSTIEQNPPMNGIAQVGYVAPAAPTQPAVDAPRLLNSQPKSSPSELQLMAEPEIFVRVQVAKLWQAPILKSLLNSESMISDVDRLRQQIGLGPEEIESLTVQIGKSTSPTTAGAQASQVNLFDAIITDFGLNASAVLKTTRPVSVESLRLDRVGVSRVEHGDLAYFLVPISADNDQSIAEAGDEDMERDVNYGDVLAAVYLLSDTEILIGSEEWIKAALQRGHKSIGQYDASLLPPTAQFAIIVAPHKEDSWIRTALLKLLSGVPDTKRTQLVQGLETIVASLTLTDAVATELIVKCSEAETAKTVFETFEEQRVSIQQLIREPEEVSESVEQDEQMASLAVFASGLSQRLKTSIDGPVVRLTYTIASPAESDAVLGDQFTTLVGHLAELAMMQIIEAAFEELIPASSDSWAFDSAPDPEGEVRDAASYNGVPDGLKLSAHTRWNPMRTYNLEGKLTKTTYNLEVVLDIKGGPVKAVSHYGMYWVDLAVADGEIPLQQSKTGDDSLGTTFARRQQGSIFADGDFSEEIASDATQALSASFYFDSPGTVSNISQWTGSIKLRIPQTTTLVTIDDLLAQVGKPIDSPELRNMRVRLKLDRDDFLRFINLQILAGEPSSIGEIKLFGSQGSRQFNRISSISYQQNGDIAISLGEKPTPGVGLQVKVHSNFKDMTVPLDFIDLPVPPLPVVEDVPRLSTPSAKTLED